ncbi:MAG: AraC family transcriptional regulator [Pseudomonadota bacterium]|nr:AraC family transcriptional regulator [Pseudomonadota bacterium]
MNDVTVTTLAQFGQAEPWLSSLVHVQRGGLLLWVTRGQGVIHMHGHRRGFSANNAIYIPPNHLWSVEFGRQILGQAVTLPPELAASFPPTEQLLRIQDGLSQSELTGLIEDMRREIQQDRPFLDDAVAAQSALLGIWLRRQVQSHPQSKKPSAAQRLMRRFCDLAALNVGSGKSMADLADALNVTPTHLTRVSRQSAGITAADLLVQALAHESRLRLTRSDLSFKTISEDLNFGSPAYFTRFIQQHTGMTPSRLRQAAHKAAKFGVSSPR